MSDVQIIDGIKNGNEAAMGYAMDKYSKLMWSLAATILVNAASAEDIEECVADVFVYLWQNHEKYQEIGFILDMDAKQVNNSLYRSKLKLREMLTDTN